MPTVTDHGVLARFRRIRFGVIVAALCISIAAPLTALAGAVGSRSHLFSLNVGFDWLAVRIAPALALVGLALGVLALAAAMIAPPRRGLAPALFAVALAAVTFGALAQWRAGMAQAPPVHDVSTDWTQTMLFSPRLMLARGPGSNPVETNPVVAMSPSSRALAGQFVAVVNAKTCPAATPITLAQPPAAAYARVKAAAIGAHLAIVTDDPSHGVLEATATSFAFGFKDDIAILVRAAGAGARIDMRASARVGQSDFGRDCRLVTRLRRAIAG